ncbi:MAG: OadG family protein [Proteobacteria bacterium]|nr:OadG family protein [Pseudomonadota bacterium]MBU4132896.1 OadG family protein [Pseudomonadota bacterium]
MIVQGLKLTLVGIIVVFLFLILLLILIHLSAKLLKPYTRKEASSLTSHRPSIPRGKSLFEDNHKLTAIISAAIAAHRKRRGRYRLP